MERARREEFDAILEEVLAELPAYVREQLDEVPVIVEDEPSEQVRFDMHDDGPHLSELCGLHHGVPLTQQSSQYAEAIAPVILLFRGPISRLAEEEGDELRRQIRITLLHEIGHHFGFGEEELAAIGYG